MRRRTLTLVALSLLLPASAHASASQVIKDCTDDGKLSKTYTQAELKAALKSLPDDVDEYTDCSDVIRSAQVRGARGVNPPTTTGGKSSGTTTTSGGSTTTTTTGSGSGATTTTTTTPTTTAPALNGPSEFGGFGDPGADPTATATKAERSQLNVDRNRGGDTPIDVGGATVDPAAFGRAGRGAATNLPAPLLAALAVLAAALLGGVALSVRAHVLTRRGP